MGMSLVPHRPSGPRDLFGYVREILLQHRPAHNLLVSMTPGK
jgi:hypothetical protein